MPTHTGNQSSPNALQLAHFHSVRWVGAGAGDWSGMREK